jgi:hypothetical protein
LETVILIVRQEEMKINKSIITLQECVKHRRIIDVDFQPSRHLLWTGICIKDNGQIAVFINLDQKRNRLDGFSVFRSKEISRFRLCEKTEYRGVTQTNIAAFLSRLNLKEMVDIPSSLQIAATHGPIAFFTEDNTKSYFVGKIVSLCKDHARFRNIGTAGIYTRYKAIKVKNINFFSFGCEYELRLEKRLKRIRPNQTSERTS